jgi:hypothetical protein
MLLAEILIVGSTCWHVYSNPVAPHQTTVRLRNDPGFLIAAIVCNLIVAIATIQLFLTTLVTEVRRDGLWLRYYPFHFSFKRIPLEDVVSVTPQAYHPILRYGGWGIRYTWKGRAYNVSGNRGVRLDYASGRHLLIGSRRPEELAQAIESIRPPQR